MFDGAPEESKVSPIAGFAGKVSASHSMMSESKSPKNSVFLQSSNLIEAPVSPKDAPTQGSSAVTGKIAKGVSKGFSFFKRKKSAVMEGLGEDPAAEAEQ